MIATTLQPPFFGGQQYTVARSCTRPFLKLKENLSAESSLQYFSLIREFLCTRQDTTEAQIRVDADARRR